jgi:glycosyltransferase involved in cell wall biosynthesis
MVAWWLGRLALPSILEIHTSPQNPFDVNLLVKSANFSSIKSVIAVTGHLRRDLVDLGIPDQRMVTLHDGVDLDQNHEVSQEHARVLLNLPPDKNLIVYTGQLHPEKGVETLIKSAARLPDSLIVLVGGDMASIARLLQLASQHDAENVIFPGYVLPRTARLYQQAADILVLPQSAQSRWSTYYTSPLKLFEYMGSRRAIVATRVPCLMEVLEHNRNAWLVDPDDPRSLGEGLSDVSRDQTLRERLATNALQTVQGFSWKNRALAILDVVRKRL